jgi:hypothetical protein
MDAGVEVEQVVLGFRVKPQTLVAMVGPEKPVPSQELLCTTLLVEEVGVITVPPNHLADLEILRVKVETLQAELEPMEQAVVEEWVVEVGLQIAETEEVDLLEL